MNQTSGAEKIPNRSSSTTQSKNTVFRFRIKNHNLLAVRDLKTESSIQKQIHGLSLSTGLFSQEIITIPRLYTIVSLNRKVPVTESLSQPSKLFLNYESYKWNEIYFHLFKEFFHQDTNNFLLDKVIYNLDFFIAFYRCLWLQIFPNTPSNLSSNFSSRFDFHRSMASLILNHKNANTLFVLYIYDLLLVSIGQGSRTNCPNSTKPLEAICILNYFESKKILVVVDNKIKINFNYVIPGLSRYKNCKNIWLARIVSGNQIGRFFLSKIFLKYAKLDTTLCNDYFEATFRHN